MQRDSVVAILVACRDHQQSKTDDVGEAVCDLIGQTRIFDTGCQTIGDAKPLFNLAQHQNAAVRRQQATVEFSDDGVAGDR
jgi:hypothetical protein